MSVICAISTAQAPGAISVIRLSGEGAIEVAARVFEPAGNKRVSDMAGYSCAYGEIKSGGERIDDGVLTIFRAPHSYTGENVAEISCHGGIYVTQRVLRACCENGAKAAQRGEFTKLAFLNGKLSLTQAESVMDTISAQGELTLRSAKLIREGALYKRSESVKGRLIKLLAQLAAWADYPEEDLPEVELETMRGTIESCEREINTLIKSFDNGMILRRGIPTAIIGKPNVGKSTLMNLMLGYERAIVTDIAGTTRDLLEETVRIGDITLKLTDTAGLRKTNDEVEKIGVEMAQRRLGESALILAVFDGSKAPDREDEQLIEQLKQSSGRVIAIINKSDLGLEAGYTELCGELTNVIELSAKSGEGKGELERIIGRMFTSFDEEDGGIFVNERQKACLDEAMRSLTEGRTALDMGMTLDAVTISLEQAAGALAELSGERISESVVDEVFSRFCVGK
ncbi:MAG: tRNA uridine-5-carboxymethylaminomethyl(34) synthesis GTPase MnmE [Ruminococcus sp.]|nr:tRNA uridine-5-carboxymethylaminomethyl(34) synthesis GTPase MnmE [Ruminococcus sp.]